jgi:hypothetical protein
MSMFLTLVCSSKLNWIFDYQITSSRWHACVIPIVAGGRPGEYLKQQLARSLTYKCFIHGFPGLYCQLGRFECSSGWTEKPQTVPTFLHQKKGRRKEVQLYSTASVIFLSPSTWEDTWKIMTPRRRFWKFIISFRCLVQASDTHLWVYLTHISGGTIPLSNIWYST